MGLLLVLFVVVALLGGLAALLRLGASALEDPLLWVIGRTLVLRTAAILAAAISLWLFVWFWLMW